MADMTMDPSWLDEYDTTLCKRLPDGTPIMLRTLGELLSAHWMAWDEGYVSRLHRLELFIAEAERDQWRCLAYSIAEKWRANCDNLAVVLHDLRKTLDDHTWSAIGECVGVQQRSYL